MPPGQSFFQQLVPHIAPVMQQHLGRHPTLLVSREPSHDNVAASHVASNRVLCLFPIGLIEFGTIDIFEVNRLAPPIVMDRETIALMDGDDSRDKVSPCESRTCRHQGDHKTSHDVMFNHDSIC